MEFIFHTTYDSAALTAMAKALRKTTRKKRSRRSHILGWIIVGLVVLLSLPRGGEYAVDLNRIVTWLAALAIVVVFFFEDRLNGCIAKKRMLPNLQSAKTIFTEDGYRSETEVGTSEFTYDNVIAVAETAQYYILVFSQNHAQVYDKRSLTGGSCSDFSEFISRVTDTAIAKV